MRLKSSKFPIQLVVLFVLIISISLLGCTSHISDNSGAEHNVSEQNLSLSLSVNFNSRSSFLPSDLNGNFTEGLTYSGVTDVTINISNESIKLEDALCNHLITESEIFFFARQDALNGFCTESFESTYGLTNFIFSYPEYVLRIIYDVYETPDGQQHLISELTIYPPDTQPVVSKIFTLNGSIIRYDQENWGVTFEIKEATPTSITIIVNQTSGQQIGQLYIDSYNLISDDLALSRLDGSKQSIEVDIPIVMEGTTELILDWSKTFGSLSAGSYYLELNIQDIFDETQIHPLMVDYYDYWSYLIAFDVT